MGNFQAGFKGLCVKILSFKLDFCVEISWTDHLEECQVGVTDVVERDLGVGPGQVLGQALRLVHHDTRIKSVVVFVETLEELPAEELDAHDGKHEPEDQADQQDVHYGGNGEHESVHHNLREKCQRSGLVC